MALTPIASGRRDHRVVVSNPGPAQPDGTGGYTETYQDAAVPWFVEMQPAGARDQERVTSGTVIAQGLVLVIGPYRDDVTTRSRLKDGAAVLSVLSVERSERRTLELMLTCAELLT